jgi:hypothetical protein
MGIENGMFLNAAAQGFEPVRGSSPTRTEPTKDEIEEAGHKMRYALTRLVNDPIAAAWLAAHLPLTLAFADDAIDNWDDTLG